MSSELTAEKARQYSKISLFADKTWRWSQSPWSLPEDVCQWMEDLSSAASSIYVYPNPTANRIYIKADNIKKAELFDLMGRKVLETNQDQLDLGNLNNGSFILQVTTEKNSTQSFKIIKQ